MSRQPSTFAAAGERLMALATTSGRTVAAPFTTAVARAVRLFVTASEWIATRVLWTLHHARERLVPGMLGMLGAVRHARAWFAPRALGVLQDTRGVLQDTRAWIRPRMLLASEAAHAWTVRILHERVAPLRRFAPVVCALGIVSGLAIVESRTSWIQSAFFSSIASRLSYTVEPGPSDALVPPRRGPLDERRGYAQVLSMQERLVRAGFRVSEQSRFSSGLVTAARWGISPPQREPTTAGLVIEDDQGRVLYDATASQYRFERFEDIPPFVVRALLYIENRRLDSSGGGRTNPAVDWGRLCRAALMTTAHRLGLPTTFQGGSTLAVQIEKFRHSDDGRTGSAADKLRQIVSASLAAYHDGPDTRDEQRRIVLDYVNGVPLAAAPGVGEVHGIGDGLRTWFGRDPQRTFEALASPNARVRAEAAHDVLALICAVRAPTHYLVSNRQSLARRTRFYAAQLAHAGLLEPALLSRIVDAPIMFADEYGRPAVAFDERKPVDLVRRELMRILDTRDLYALDGLHVDVETSLDAALQDSVRKLFRNLRDPEYLASHGLIGPRMLTGDPTRVVYSLRVLEHDDDGEHVIVHADNQDKPLDVNEGTRLELGSTAKLRTLVHYLEIVGFLYAELRPLPLDSLAQRARTARDPITAWAAARLAKDSTMTVDSLIAGALDRRYSASPGEVFFTGGGAHEFHNFDPHDNGSIFAVREAAVRSNNLVFIRLMRDLVRFHAARLTYDASAALHHPDDPKRLLLLNEIADEEALSVLDKAWNKFHGSLPDQLPGMMVGGDGPSARQLTALYFAWHEPAGVDSLRGWLRRYHGEAAAEQAEELAAPFFDGHFSIADYGFLVGRHPLEVWCAGELFRNPSMSKEDLKAASVEARRVASEWLFKTRNQRARGLRIRTRIERDAFARMTPYWRRLGFPFQRLVPSYATAIGSSADRPGALADLMGVIMNDGVKRPTSLLRKVRLAPGTPYHTVLELARPPGKNVLLPSAARAIREVLSDVVERGTARRAYDAFRDSLGQPVEVGGKTGSGDNRVKVYAAGGRLIESRPVSRCAAFTFYIGDRHYGVITASVTGPESGDYEFTSSLPVAILRLLAPALDKRLGS